MTVEAEGALPAETGGRPTNSGGTLSHNNAPQVKDDVGNARGRDGRNLGWQPGNFPQRNQSAQPSLIF